MCAITPSNTRRYLLVGIEPFVKKLPEKAPVLGGAEYVCVARSHERAGLMFESGGDIAKCSESQPGDNRALSLIT
jgi:hypothetical protein